MVGKMNFAGLRERLSQVTSHDSGSIGGEEMFKSQTGSSFLPLRRHVPFIASPLDPKTSDWIEKRHNTSNLTLKRRPTIALTEANSVSNGIFRKQEEASPLELFFDLFFVANLAVFGFSFSQATPSTLGNYIGFFSLMWSFWFHVSIHDVRFYVDSILNRFLKLCQFAIWCTFTGLGPIYEAIEGGGTTRAFHGLALVFMASRFFLLVQYGVILWFVRPFKKTLVPLTLMMLIYLCTGFAFLGTYLDGEDHDLTGEEGVRRVNVWYAIIGIEALLVIGVSSIWRILSFKRTHLVERVGLLTLIVIGEGIIGVIRCIADVLDGSRIDVWQAIGRVIAGVFLIYLIFVLYFSPIAHDRFGTIRQQIWVLLHYPLHLSILLTLEGSAESMLWTTIIGSRRALINGLPNLLEPSHGYDTINALVEKINETFIITSEAYDHLSLEEVYNWMPDLDRIANLTSTYEYASESFNEHAGEIMGEMVNETTNYFFENFQFEGPEIISHLTDANEILAAYYNGYIVLFTAFYLCAGILLLTLAVMYWVGKNNKTWEEWLSIGARIIGGVALPPVVAAAYTQPWETGFIFSNAGWLVSIVVFTMLFVVIVDNVCMNIFDRRLARHASSGSIGGALEAGDGLQPRPYNGAFGPRIPSPQSSSGHIPRISEMDEKGTSASANNLNNTNSNTRNIRFEDISRSPSDDNTLTGRRDSEQALQMSQPKNSSSPSITPPASSRQRDERSYYQPHPTVRNNSNTNSTGYGRLDHSSNTAYRGHRLDEDDDEDTTGNGGDIGQGERERFVNDDRLSFELERLEGGGAGGNQRGDGFRAQQVGRGY